MPGPPSELEALGRRARAAAQILAVSSRVSRDYALMSSAELIASRSVAILAANAEDVSRCEEAGASDAAIDRLRLSKDRLSSMIGGLRQVASLPDPVGEVVEGSRRPNGLSVERVRVPLGVVGIIYENRPNVTADAAALCLKAGNAALLRGSAAAIESNRAIASALRDGLEAAELPADAVILIEDVTHEAAQAFVQLRGVIDCLIPRGGPALISMILDKATVPYVIDGDGNCHV
ncbi:MAG: aldehyde dehydrogenase family protein, partial [Acidimicrobiales bacterium]